MNAKKPPHLPTEKGTMDSSFKVNDLVIKKCCRDYLNPRCEKLFESRGQ
ncbi:hypothetical protein PEPS_35080 (plasmid) [Persicobacter psychrovividus]|uniref:Uncharacterized protein n=1 Tax=Persicobacter psychrovividus TaxID=387638 RepID=A0ABM7VJR6_9BACT|nr:hypothetical protein PEPS_35080 [Persicobacter psychrovividus]